MSYIQTKADLAGLKGAEIIDAYTNADDNGMAWPALLIRMPEGQEIEIEISQDSEGNGPGYIFGLPVVAEVTS